MLGLLYKHKCVCAYGGQRSTTGVIHSSGYIYLVCWDRVSGPQSSLIFLGYLVTKHLFSSGIANIHCHTQLFTQVLGDITAVCRFAWQALNQLSSLSSPKFCFFRISFSIAYCYHKRENETRDVYITQNQPCVLPIKLHRHGTHSGVHLVKHALLLKARVWRKGTHSRTYLDVVWLHLSICVEALHEASYPDHLQKAEGTIIYTSLASPCTDSPTEPHSQERLEPGHTDSSNCLIPFLNKGLMPTKFEAQASENSQL